MQPTVGDRIRSIRIRRGLSQQSLADLAGMSRSFLAELEANGQSPRVRDLRKIASVLNEPIEHFIVGEGRPPRAAVRDAATVQPSDLGGPGSLDILSPVDSVAGGDGEDNSEDVNRRQLLRLGASLVALAPFELARLLASRAGDRHLHELNQITNQYASWYWRMSPASLLPYLIDHQVRLMALIETVRGRIRRPLLTVGSETAVVAGLAAYKRDDLGMARRQFDLAVELANEANDGSALAHVYRAQRNVVSSAAVRGGNHQDSIRALSMLDSAVTVAGSNAPRLQLAMLFATRAEERAVMGMEREALQDIDRADQALAQAGAPETGYYDHWSEARLQGWHASVLLYLGRPAEAAVVLERAVPGTPVELVSDRADVLGDLGAAYAQAAEPERAVACLKDSLTVAKLGGIDDGVARIRFVRNRHLLPYGSLPAVRELDDQLAAM